MSLDEDTGRCLPDESGTVLELHFASEAAANVHLLGAIFGEASRAGSPNEEASTSSCGAPRAMGALAAPLARPGDLDRMRRVTGSLTGSLGRPRYLAQQASARRGEVDSSPSRGMVRANNVWQLRFDSVTELQAWRADIERLKVGRPMTCSVHCAMYPTKSFWMRHAYHHAMHHAVRHAMHHAIPMQYWLRAAPGGRRARRAAARTRVQAAAGVGGQLERKLARAPLHPR